MYQNAKCTSRAIVKFGQISNVTLFAVDVTAYIFGKLKSFAIISEWGRGVSPWPQQAKNSSLLPFCFHKAGSQMNSSLIIVYTIAFTQLERKITKTLELVCYTQHLKATEAAIK